MDIKKINSNNQLHKNRISFGIIKPEHLFIDINGYGRDLSWAKEMIDAINISSKKIQSGENDFDKILKFIAKTYRVYFRNLEPNEGFGCLRSGRISTPLGGERYCSYQKKVKLLMKKEDKIQKTVSWPKQFFEIIEEPTELEKSPAYRVKTDLHIMKTIVKRKKIPLTETYKILEFPKGVKVESDGDSNEVFLWHHTRPEYIPDMMAYIKNLYTKILKIKNDKVDEIIPKISEFQWLLCQTAPFRRGSAGITDVITKTLFEAKRIQISPWKQNIAPDLEALTQNLDNYRINYPKLFQTLPKEM